WNFVGKNRSDLTDNITVSDVQWFLQYAGRITDARLRTALSASGQAPEDTECYVRSLRDRIGQLQPAAGSSRAMTERPAIPSISFPTIEPIVSRLRSYSLLPK